MISNQVPVIFDRGRLKRHRARAVVNFAEHDFLFREMAQRLCDRLEYIKRDFPLTLDLGAHNGILDEILGGRGGIENLVQLEISENLLCGAKNLRAVADEELLPFAENSFDLVISVGSLHWVNDLAGTLIQIQRSLKPDGLFLAIFFGGQTLQELRASFEKAEMEFRGGLSPRISPFIDVQTAGGLLQRAGFALPVVDSEMLTVEYNHPLKLMKELRGMGETNILHECEKNFTPCSLMMLAIDNYMQDFSNEEQRIEASFELITLTGWKPHSSQQKPLSRGSGKIPLSQVVKIL
jgi:NADH dehydrogenase [ubiquinone] 1 alpha subcomplex assembly factor 5